MKSAITAVLLMCAAAFGQQQPSQPKTPDINKAVEFAKIAQKQMRDPESFRIEWVRFGASDKGDKEAYCIKYRAKNGFGGYGDSAYMSEIFVTKKDGEVKSHISEDARACGADKHTTTADITEQVKAKFDPSSPSDK
jgi:hypothetical protein